MVLILAAGIAGYVYAITTRGNDTILFGVQYRSSNGAVAAAWFSREQVAPVPAAGAHPPVPEAPHAPNAGGGGGSGQPGHGHPAQHRPAYPQHNQYLSIAPPPAQYGPGQSQYGYPAPQGYYPNGSNAGGNMGGWN